MVIDEKQSTLDDSKISTLLYSLAEGRTRMKATKDSDLITNKRFELNVITSGEEPINETSHTGASRRTVEIYVKKIFKDNETSIKAHTVSKKCYGLAGEVFVNKLIDDYSDSSYQEVKDKYEEIQRLLQEKLENEAVRSYIQSISVIILADILMNKTFNFGFDEASSIELGLNILNQLKEEKEIDEVERAKEILENWLIINDKKFHRQSFNYEYQNLDNANVISESLDNEGNSIEMFGMYQDGIYYVIPLKFNELMRQNNLSPNKIRRGFAEKGYILIDEANNRFTVNKFYNGGNRRMLAYKLKNEKSTVSKEIEGEVEESIISKGMYKGTYEDLISEEAIKEFSDSLEIKREELEDEY